MRHSFCLVLLNLIKAVEGADLPSGPIMLKPGKNIALKYVASLDSATLNYVLLHCTKLDQHNNKQGENVYQHLKKRERMGRALCFHAEFSLLFSLMLPIQLGLIQKQKTFFLSALNDIFHLKSAREASISIHISSWCYM